MADVKRSVSLTLVNRSGTEMTWDVKASSGPPLTAANGATVLSTKGTQLLLTAQSTSEACTGTLKLRTHDDAANTCLEFDYCASYDDDKTGLTITPRSGYAIGTQAFTQGDNSITGVYTVYTGVAQTADSSVQILSLTDAPMTLAESATTLFADFTNAMFDPAVRSTDSLNALVKAATKKITDQWDAGQGPPVFYADMTGGQIPVMVKMWKDYWINGVAGACPAPDAVLIDFIKGFISDNSPQLWIPRLTVHDADPPAVFNLKGYDSVGFRKADGSWSDGTIARFLTMLASGAHFVSVCANDDIKPIGLSYKASADFYAAFASAAITRGDDLGSSHYISDGFLNTSGWYFLDIEGEWMPTTVRATPSGGVVTAGLLNALMTGVTVTGIPGAASGGYYSGFFQLEGWQQQGLTGGDRHMADYDAYNAILWNISTFGASPYSEKRATTVFLAPKGWVPVVTQVTRMMPYVGAYATYSSVGGQYLPQGWLDTDLVRIDGSTAAGIGNHFVRS